MGYVPPKHPIPGFQNTVNHYGVGMWDRDSNNIQQWIKMDFTAYEDGRLDIPLTFENNTYFGFRGSIRVIARDAIGQRLLDVVSPEYAIGPKNPLHATIQNRATIGWSFRASPDVGIYGADLYGIPAVYERDSLPFGLSFGTLVQIAVMVVNFNPEGNSAKLLLRSDINQVQASQTGPSQEQAGRFHDLETRLGAIEEQLALARYAATP